MSSTANSRPWMELLKSLVSTGVILAVFNWFYGNYLAMPHMAYQASGNQDVFSAEEKFRSISMYAHPQLLIRYGGYVLGIIRLERFYRSDFVHFTDSVGRFERINQESCAKVREHIRAGILSRLSEALSPEAMAEIEQRLTVDLSLLGGVEYENRLGNEIKPYCIIEEDGNVLDYPKDSSEIEHRLCERTVVLGEYLLFADLEQYDEIRDTIEEAAAKIGGIPRA